MWQLKAGESEHDGDRDKCHGRKPFLFLPGEISDTAKDGGVSKNAPGSKSPKKRMKEKEVIIFGIATKTIALQPFNSLSEQNKFYAVYVVPTSHNFFRVQIILKIKAINNGKDKCGKSR